MPKSLVYLLAAACCSPAWSVVAVSSAVTNTPFTIDRKLLGSGQQSAPGEEIAQPVGGYGVWHVPQYLPGYPTSATIWPRAVVVKCKNKRCEGYVITPQMGPGEYLFFIPSEEGN
ncbi:hypothetical protein GCM10010975_10170 [Comamonas phosphati]|nr:hypothetical protein GCM10010975_10170 [Comamonas phosphati]